MRRAYYPKNGPQSRTSGYFKIGGILALRTALARTPRPPSRAQLDTFQPEANSGAALRRADAPSAPASFVAAPWPQAPLKTISTAQICAKMGHAPKAGTDRDASSRHCRVRRMLGVP